MDVGGAAPVRARKGGANRGPRAGTRTGAADRPSSSVTPGSGLWRGRAWVFGFGSPFRVSGGIAGALCRDIYGDKRSDVNIYR